jgi:hypothetical protein
LPAKSIIIYEKLYQGGDVDKKKVWIILTVVFGIILLALIGYLIYKNKSLNDELNTKTPTPTATISTTKIATMTKTPTATATVAAKTDEELIKEALATKLSSDAANLTVTISKKSAAAAFGTVSVNGEMGGGWFVAAKAGDEWKIIADGNGTIDCALMDQYDIPNTVVGECYDSVTDTTKTR